MATATAIEMARAETTVIKTRFPLEVGHTVRWFHKGRKFWKVLRQLESTDGFRYRVRPTIGQMRGCC